MRVLTACSAVDGEPATEMLALRVLPLQRVDTTRENRRMGGGCLSNHSLCFFSFLFFFSVGKKYSDSKQSLNTFYFKLIAHKVSQVVPVVKNPFAKQEMCVRSLEEDMGTHSSVLA